jgi:hypothetical protein
VDKEIREIRQTIDPRPRPAAASTGRKPPIKPTATHPASDPEQNSTEGTSSTIQPADKGSDEHD